MLLEGRAKGSGFSEIILSFTSRPLLYLYLLKIIIITKNLFAKVPQAQNMIVM